MSGKVSKNLLAILIPQSTLAWLNTIVAGLSIFALFFKTRDEGLSSALQVVLKYHRELLDFMFGWAQVPLEYIVTSIIGNSVHFAPIWADVAMLSGIYFLRNIVRLLSAGRVSASIYQFFCAIPIMLFAGAGAGLFYDTNDELSVWLMTLFPITGIFLMSVSQGVWFAIVPQDRVCRTWRDFGGSTGYFVLMQTWYGFQVALCGAVLSALFIALVFWADFPDPPVMVLFLLILALAAYWLLIGLRAAVGWESQAMPPDLDGPMLQRIAATSAVRLGTAMLQTVYFFLVFLLFNAAAP